MLVLVLVILLYDYTLNMYSIFIDALKIIILYSMHASTFLDYEKALKKLHQYLTNMYIKRLMQIHHHHILLQRLL